MSAMITTHFSFEKSADDVNKRSEKYFQVFFLWNQDGSPVGHDLHSCIMIKCEDQNEYDDQPDQLGEQEQ